MPVHIAAYPSTNMEHRKEKKHTCNNILTQQEGLPSLSSQEWDDGMTIKTNSLVIYLFSLVDFPWQTLQLPECMCCGQPLVSLWQYIVHAISWSSIPHLGIHQLAYLNPIILPHPAARTLGSWDVPHTRISEPPTRHILVTCMP